MRLIDHAAEALRIATALPGGSADPVVLRSRCESALTDFAAAAARAGHAGEGIDAARFALVALIDERAMAQGSPVRQEWLDQPLQLRLFECASAGEEFYRRLDRWRRPPTEAAADVLEVYQTCLALGFRGMMVGESQEAARRQLAEQTATEVLGQRQLPEHGLSPRWRPTPMSVAEESGGHIVTQRTWLIPAAAILIVVAVWLLTGWWVAARAGEVVAELR
jgi:type IV/VI secretion system ImpK/VasF family protein